MNKKVNAKREAYAKKEEEKGKKVVAWIFGSQIYFVRLFTREAHISVKKQAVGSGNKCFCGRNLL